MAVTKEVMRMAAEVILDHPSLYTELERQLARDIMALTEKEAK